MARRSRADEKTTARARLGALVKEAQIGKGALVPCLPKHCICISHSTHSTLNISNSEMDGFQAPISTSHHLPWSGADRGQKRAQKAIPQKPSQLPQIYSHEKKHATGIQ